MSEKNHWRKSKCQAKVAATKLEKYGDSSYNNIVKGMRTIQERYGVYCAFDLPQSKSNGRRISKFQRRVYGDVLKEHADALLEEYLPDAKKSVDIYIPSLKKVIECNGDYWHCNPIRYEPDYYNKSVHLTAQQIWDRDAQRIKELKSIGYDVKVLWESASKRRHSLYL